MKQFNPELILIKVFKSLIYDIHTELMPGIVQLYAVSLYKTKPLYHMSQYGYKYQVIYDFHRQSTLCIACYVMSWMMKCLWTVEPFTNTDWLSSQNG